MASAVVPLPSPASDEARSDALAPDAPPAMSDEAVIEAPAPTRRATPPPSSVREGAPRSVPVMTPRPLSSAASSFRPGATPLPPLSSRRRDPEGPPAAPRNVPGLAGIAARYPAPGSEVAEPPAGPPRPPSGGVYLSPRMTAIFGGLFGLATLTSVIALLIQVVPPKNERALIAGSASPSGSGSAGAAPRGPEVKKRERTPIPGPWRVSELAKDPAMTVIDGVMNRRSLMEALNEKGVPKAQVYRVMKAFDATRKFDKSGKKDRFVVAMERESHRVKAFEYELTPSEIWQSREGEDGILHAGEKLDLKIGEGEVTAAFYIGSDLSASYQAAGLEDGIVQAMDDALAGHMSSESFEEGGTVRVIAIEETALGLFSRYKRIVALEYRPPDPAAKPVRIYTFNGQEAKGYWDDRGKQPYSGGWSSPVPTAPVTSRFNPKRMHPVLHKIMPHTGTDYGAPTGTPIYAAYRGVIETIGPLGPCGNAVQIQHPGNILTGYCHMSRFAPALKAGDKVGTHRLIGYVGTTGRSTGPHLHFFAKRGGVFFDAETLQLNGERVVPPGDRQGFLAAKGELDRRLEAIPLPEPPADLPKPAAAASGSADAPDAPPAPTGKTAGKDREAPSKGPRSAVVVGSPAAIASAAAEPGIHPKGFIEDNSEDDEVDPGPVTPKGGKPAPPDEEDDEH